MVPGFLKFAQQKGLFGAVRKEHVDGLEMRAGHRENVRRAIDQCRGQRLAPQTHGMSTPSSRSTSTAKRLGGLPANRMHAGGSDRDILAIAEQMAEKTLCHWAPADVSGTDKKNVFHGVERANRAGLANLKSNGQVNRPGLRELPNARRKMRSAPAG